MDEYRNANRSLWDSVPYQYQLKTVSGWIRAGQNKLDARQLGPAGSILLHLSAILAWTPSVSAGASAPVLLPEAVNRPPQPGTIPARFICSSYTISLLT